mmetsp:Transcript_14074/g.33182  ORF Transcript_14074/g.33182 Transcript_14074/m.33182 type:complete len:90 (+) Transcript_14074:372-641(+)
MPQDLKPCRWKQTSEEMSQKVIPRSSLAGVFCLRSSLGYIWCVANAVSTSACARFMQRVTTDSPVCKQGLGICTNLFCLPILAAAIIFR